MQFVNHRTLQYPGPLFIGPYAAANTEQYGAFSMKALARYQVILLGVCNHKRKTLVTLSRLGGRPLPLVPTLVVWKGRVRSLVGRERAVAGLVRS